MCICVYIVIDKPGVKDKCADYLCATLTEKQGVVIQTDVGDCVRITCLKSIYNVAFALGLEENVTLVHAISAQSELAAIS